MGFAIENPLNSLIIENEKVLKYKYCEGMYLTYRVRVRLSLGRII